MTIWWIRRDLRLADNPALAAALARGGPVVPVFVRDAALLARGPHADAPKRLAFLHGGLRTLDASLRARGSRLVVRSGEPGAVLGAIVRECGAVAVVAEEDLSPYARRRDAVVGASVPLTLSRGVVVHHPTAVVKDDGTPYTVFTPFSRAWLRLLLVGLPDHVRVPDALPAPVRWPASEALPDDEPPTEFVPGEDEAMRRLHVFAAGARAPIHAYARERNRVDRPGTSTLSPYLRFGMVSARACVAAALAAGARPAATRGAARTGADVWLAELIWREFYLAVLWHFPHVLGRAFVDDLTAIRWRRAPADLRAWQEGRTGYPIVDAAMRQLSTIGWMHNRARMIVASFLTKDLLLDWRAGEAWFMRHLVDGDPAANNGGWQWTAGTGTDAAPYFRVFNPLLQAKTCDPDGDYVRRWVPELARIRGAAVHAPWELAPLELRAAGVTLDRDYPRPIVDHATGRARALAAYGAARGRT